MELASRKPNSTKSGQFVLRGDRRMWFAAYRCNVTTVPTLLAIGAHIFGLFFSPFSSPLDRLSLSHARALCSVHVCDRTHGPFNTLSAIYCSLLAPIQPVCPQCQEIRTTNEFDKTTSRYIQHKSLPVYLSSI